MTIFWEFHMPWGSYFRSLCCRQYHLPVWSPAMKRILWNVYSRSYCSKRIADTLQHRHPTVQYICFTFLSNFDKPYLQKIGVSTIPTDFHSEFHSASEWRYSSSFLDACHLALHKCWTEVIVLCCVFSTVHTCIQWMVIGFAVTSHSQWKLLIGWKTEQHAYILYVHASPYRTVSNSGLLLLITNRSASFFICSNRWDVIPGQLNSSSLFDSYSLQPFTFYDKFFNEKYENIIEITRQY